jgi:nucleoside-diphosphate-sugar epimerase
VQVVRVGDLGSHADWRQAVKDVDVIVHLAGRAHSALSSDDDEAACARINTDGTLQLARAAEECGVPRFVYVSTAKVNGETSSDGVFRADDPPNPQDAYARSKLAAEVGLRALTSLEVVVIRPPLVYGPGVKGNLARLCRLAHRGVPVPFAGISNRRDLVGTRNLADLIELVIRHPAAAGGTFMVADGSPISTPQLYRLICSAMQRPARMFGVPTRLLRVAAAPFGFAPEIDRLTQSFEIDISHTVLALGWKPRETIEQGIDAMVQAYLRVPV